MNEQSNDVSTSQLDNSDSIHDAVAGLQALQQVPNDAPDVPYDAPVESVSRGSTEMAVSAVATAIPLLCHLLQHSFDCIEIRPLRWISMPA